MFSTWCGGGGGGGGCVCALMSLSVYIHVLKFDSKKTFEKS